MAAGVAPPRAAHCTHIYPVLSAPLRVNRRTASSSGNDSTGDMAAVSTLPAQRAWRGCSYCYLLLKSTK